MHKVDNNASQPVPKFGSPELIKTVLELSVFNIVLILLGINAIPAHLVSATVALAFSLVVNKRFVYGPSLKRRFSQVLLLLLVTSFGLYVVQTLIIFTLLETQPIPLASIRAFVASFGVGGVLTAEIVVANVAKLAAITAGIGSNFFLYRHLNLTTQRLRAIDSAGDWLAGHKDLLVLVAILSVAAVARLWNLHALPPGLSTSEAVNGLHALSIMDGDLRLFYNGQEGMFYYLQALLVAAIGNTVVALRLVPAVLGIASVFLVYLAVKEWFSARVALLAGFFMAIAPWAVHTSRIGESANLLVLILPVLMLAVARAIKTNAARWWVIVGLILGLGFYSHLSFYAVIMVIVSVFIYARFRYSHHLQRMKQPLVIVLLSLSLIMIPFGIQLVLDPGVLINRDTELGLLQQNAAEDGLMITGIKALTRTAGMFYIAGDRDYAHNLGGEPQLNIFVGVMLILGVLLALKRWRDIRYFSLLVCLAAFTLPSALAGTNAPDAMLAAGAIPFVFVLAAIGLVEMYVRWKGVFPFNLLAYNFALMVLIVVGMVAGVYNYQRYFVAWANAPETFKAYNVEANATARYMLSEPGEEGHVVVTDSQNDSVISFLTSSKVNYERIKPIDFPVASQASSKVFLIPNTVGLELPSTRGFDCNQHDSNLRHEVVLFTECRVAERQH